MKPQEENKYYCDVCKNAIGKIQNVLSFEGAINKKDWVDYTLCWECSKN